MTNISITSKAFEKAARGKRVLVRMGWDIPLTSTSRISNTSRIDVTLPTIKRILACKPSQIVFMCHMGRPDSVNPNKNLQTDVVAKYLSKVLKKPVAKMNSFDEEISHSKLVVLENLRFNVGEKKNSIVFARKLASFGDVYVNEAFSVSHRKHASLFATPKQFPVAKRFAGLVLENEISKLSRIVTVQNKERPFVAIIGFSKIGDKMKIFEKIIRKADKVLIGGAVVFTFMRALGLETGKSMIDTDSIVLAKKLLTKYSKKIILPIDFVGKDKKVRAYDTMTKSFVGLDIGPQSTKLFCAALTDAKLVFWNGPTGMFEVKPFDKSTRIIAKRLYSQKIKTIVGGGDTAAAMLSIPSISFEHISTGGGASLEFIEKGKLPAIEVLR